MEYLNENYLKVLAVIVIIFMIYKYFKNDGDKELDDENDKLNEELKYQKNKEEKKKNPIPDYKKTYKDRMFGHFHTIKTKNKVYRPFI